MAPRPSITLRFGASHDDITVDGHVFRRHKLTKGEFAFVRNVIIDSLIKVGSVKRRGPVRLIDLDKLNNIDPTPVAHKALTFLDQVSDHEKEVQGAALAITFIAYCRRHGVDPGVFWTVGANILNSKHQENPTWWALHAYLEHET